MHTASERHNGLILEMMERLGIEPGGGVVPHYSLTYDAAFHTCAACASKDACRDWLDEMPAEMSFAPRFCPNAAILFELQVALPGADYLAAGHPPLTHNHRKNA